MQIFNPPENLAEAFRRAKLFQSVNKTDKFQGSSLPLDNLEKWEDMVKQLSVLINKTIFKNAVSISTDFRDEQGDNLSCSIDEGENLSSLNNDIYLLEKQINYCLKNSSSLNNDDDLLEKK